MHFGHVLVATDESLAARRATAVGLEIARVVGARVTLLRVAPPGEGVAVLPIVPAGAADLEVATAVASGIPSVEICRFAEGVGAGLILLGRTPRPQASRLLLGDTADAVARRSHLACLFIMPNTEKVARVLAAVDGTVRGMIVLQAAYRFATCTGGHLRVVTVEPDYGAPVAVATSVPSGRSWRFVSAIGELPGARIDTRPIDRTNGISSEQIQVRHGDPVEQILHAASEDCADVLAIGYHRGGPPGSIEAGSVSRRLAHTVPGAVLTVPL